MIKLNDFTNQELINAVVSWLKDQEAIYGNDILVGEIIYELEEGDWLRFINNKLKDELPHNNC